MNILRRNSRVKQVVEKSVNLTHLCLSSYQKNLKKRKELFFMKYEKPMLIKISKDELRKFILVKANSACGSSGCENAFAGNKPDCEDTYHNACLDENNWSSGECITGGSWRDR